MSKDHLVVMAQLGLAVFALDGDLKVVFANHPAESMLRATTRLRLIHGQLSATVAAENAGLQAAMMRTLKSRQGESFTLRSESGLQPEVFLSIGRLAVQDNSEVFAHAEMLMTARCRRDAPLVAAPQLRQAFGLSTAEAAVAEALVAGQTPDEYARSANISVATVRTQLRAIFEKTGTRSEAEAVGMMLWVPAHMDGAGGLPTRSPEQHHSLPQVLHGREAEFPLKPDVIGNRERNQQ